MKSDPYQSAVLHFQAGHYAEAQSCCQQSLQEDPENANALHLMGTLHLLSGRYDEAVGWLVDAIRKSPQPNYLVSLGHALLKLGRGDEAIRCFDKAVQLKPDDAGGLWKQFGEALLQLQRHDLALTAFQRVTELDPSQSDAFFKSGVLLYYSGKYQEALTCFDRCPESAVLHRERGRTLQELRRFAEALNANQKADAIEPGNGDTCNNIGSCLRFLGREEEALHWYERADAALPGTVEILNNKALLLGDLQRFEEAFALYDDMKTRGLGNALTDWNRSQIELLTGDFDAGWRGREARWSKPNPIVYPALDRPMWLGEGPVDGKTILLHVDEGLGDTIQFVRYTPMLADRGARVIMVVEPAARQLLAALPGVSQCLSYPGSPLPAFDLHCAIGSLPLAFRTRLETIPAATAYLPRPAEDRIDAWESRLAAGEGLRVGLVWSGNPAHLNDRNRSMPLSMMAGLLDIDASFVSLQKDPRPADKAFLATRTDIQDFTVDLADLSDTAALIECLDLVITVDTSIAHLAGALGRPTWILLPYTPDYRWLLGRDDSPWYPSARLFRQTETREYGQVIDQVRKELTELVLRQRRLAGA
jgi:tetratricopeptide (TPR) repeat protein